MTSVLKFIYRAPTESQAFQELDCLTRHGASGTLWWSARGRQNWDELATIFQYPEEVRRLIYTTNIIEGFHRQLRKVTKNKGAFPSDEALSKLLYLVTQDVTAKWWGASTGISSWPNSPSSLKLA